MPYLPNINSYLQQSSLLLQAYPTTTRITTKYSLPPKQKTKPLKSPPPKAVRERQPPAATLTFKTFEITAGICLKYRTNKSAEVGRLMTGLGKLAKGDMIEESNPKTVGAEEMEIDTPKVEKTHEPAAEGKARKKKGKK